MMLKPNKKDIGYSAKLIAKAMFNDDLHTYFFPDEKKRLYKLSHIYNYKLNSDINNVYTTSANIEGIAIWEKPNNHHSNITFNDIIKGFSLPFKVGISSLYRIIKYQIWAVKIRKKLVREPFWYLDIIAVNPEEQGKGFAGKLIEPVLNKARERNEKIYLETQNNKNISLYEKYGFKLVHTAKLGKTSVNHYCMIMYS